MLFKHFAVPFFEKRRVLVLARELSAASFRVDEIRFNKILPRFANRALSKVTPLDIDKYLDSLLLNGKSPATRNRYRAFLHIYFKLAIRMGFCKKNPVTDTPILSERIKTRATGYWSTPLERDLYIKTAFEFGPVYGIGAYILCLGGCRISEAMALQFKDIEWDLNYCRIRRIVERHSGLICDRTKGQRAGGEYQMILVPRLWDALKKWKGTALYRKDDDFILHIENGRPFTYDKYALAHEKIVAKADLKRITLHDLRRTFATHADRMGFHKSEIGELLGHETLSATEVYTRMDISHLVEKAKRIGFGR